MKLMKMYNMPDEYDLNKRERERDGRENY